jgi:hypothetical protein
MYLIQSKQNNIINSVLNSVKTTIYSIMYWIQSKHNSIFNSVLNILLCFDWIQFIIEHIVVFLTEFNSSLNILLFWLIQYIIEYIVVFWLNSIIIEYIVLFLLNDSSVSTKTQRDVSYQKFTFTAVWTWMMWTTLIISSL